MKRTALSVFISVFSLCLCPPLSVVPFYMFLFQSLSFVLRSWKYVDDKRFERAENKFERNSVCKSTFESAHRHGFVRAELDLCTREDRIVSVTDDLCIQEESCNYI